MGEATLPYPQHHPAQPLHACRPLPAADRAAKCAQYRKGTMPKALKDCVCNTAQPLFYCESRLHADLESRFGDLLKGGGQAALARKLQEQMTEELSTLFAGLRRDMRQHRRDKAAPRGGQPAAAAGAVTVQRHAYGRQLAEGAIKAGCNDISQLVGGPLCCGDPEGAIDGFRLVQI